MTCAGTLGNWFHVLLVAPFLIYESYYPNPTYLFTAGMVVLLLHVALILWKCGLIPFSLAPCCGAFSVPNAPQPQKEPMPAQLNQSTGYAFEDFQMRL